MASTPLSRLLLLGETSTSSTRKTLEEAGFAVTSRGFSGVEPSVVSEAGGVVLEVSPATLSTAQALSRRWRIEMGEHYVPILWMIEKEIAPTSGLDAGADITLPSNTPPEHLVAQIKALLRIQHLQTRLESRSAEAQHLNTRLQQAYQQLDGDLELTRRIHRGFLPRSLPEVGNAQFAVCYRPRSRIGGDFYDVIRLDEETVGVFVADAMGRGLPASSLLSIFVKKSLLGKEIVGRSYRLVPPNEVLDRLNRELVNLSLAEPPFVTMLYLQMNCRDGNVSFARAAHPHPLMVPQEGEPEYWRSQGSLLGIFDADYPLQTHQLHSGDKLILYSDGVHPVSSSPGGDSDPLIAAVNRHRHLPLQAFVDQVSRDVLEEVVHPEDFTLLAIEYR
jgi:sigma-B regulation protein RsbU (phosphoserine phosphatase)